MKKTFNKSLKSKEKNFRSSKDKTFYHLLSSLRNIVRWLNFSFETEANYLLPMIQDLITKLISIVKDRKAKGALKYFKDVRRALSSYLSGTKISNPGIKCTYDGIPQILGDLIPVIRGRSMPGEVLPLIYTVFTCTRSLKFGTSPDLNPIINPAKFPVMGPFSSFKDIEINLRDFWSSLGYRPSKRTVPKAVNWKNFHITSKSGPNGHAFSNSLHELYLLPYDLVDDLVLCGGKKFSKVIHELKSLPLELRSELIPFNSKRNYRKITYFPDKEEKVRVVAILDYWSQTVLKPLHDYLNEVLKKIPQDCTFDQAGFWSKISKSKVFYSIDLTAATDRFPIEFIKIVLKAKFPASYVDAWARIMVGHPFRFTDKVSLSYSVGNPMGAYSSWASFAVAHHFVVYDCIRSLGLKWQDVPYCLLGDDIVIGHKEVAELYILRIESLGVEISKSKTHISEHFCEFAKRLIYKGREITPFPISSLKETSKRYYLLTGLLLDTKKKGWIPKVSVPSSVGLFYEIIKKYNSRRRKVLINNSQQVELIMTMINGPEPANVTLSGYIRKHCHLPEEFPDDESNILINKLISRVAYLSMEKLTNAGSDKYEPFGKSYNKQLKIVNSYRETDLLSVGISNSSLPIVGVTDTLMYRLAKLDREVMDKFERKGALKELLRVSGFPSSDKIFSQRSYYRTLANAAFLGKQMDLLLKSVKDRGFISHKGKPYLDLELLQNEIYEYLGK